MAEKIIAQLFELHEHEIDSHDEKFVALWDQIKNVIDHDTSEQLYSVVIDALYEARQEGFKAGWQMRAQL